MVLFGCTSRAQGASILLAGFLSQIWNMWSEISSFLQNDIVGRMGSCPDHPCLLHQRLLHRGDHLGAWLLRSSDGGWTKVGASCHSPSTGSTCPHYLFAIAIGVCLKGAIKKQCLIYGTLFSNITHCNLQAPFGKRFTSCKNSTLKNGFVVKPVTHFQHISKFASTPSPWVSLCIFYCPPAIQ